MHTIYKITIRLYRVTRLQTYYVYFYRYLILYFALGKELEKFYYKHYNITKV